MTGQVHGRKGNDMYEMKYLTEDDMPYFRRLAKEGRAVIIELSDQALFELDMDSFRLPSGEIDRKKLEEVRKYCEIRKIPVHKYSFPGKRRYSFGRCAI